MSFALPPLVTAADAPKALAAVVQAVSNGDLTASEAADLAGLIETFAHAIEVNDLETRITTLEQRTKK